MNRTTTTPDPTARRRAVVIALCWALVLLDGIDTFVYGSVLPEMIGSGQLGLTDATAGEIGSATTFGMLVGTVLSGTVTRWVGRRPAVFASVALFTAATLGSGLAGSAVVFGFCRLLCGFGLGALLPIAIAYGMEFWPGNRRALATGVITTAHQAGGALAPLIALVLVDTAGWRWVFVAGAVPAVVLLPVAVRLLPESPAILAARGRSQEAAAVSAEHGLASAAPVPAAPAPERPDRWAGLRALFRGGRWPVTLLFWLTSFAGLMLVYGVGQWLPKIMGDLGYETGDALLFSTALNVGGIVGMVVAGRLADLVGARRIVVAWFALTAVFVHLLGVHLPVAVLYVVVFFAGLLLFSGQSMVYAAVGAHHDAGDRDTALGWVAGMGRFGAVFGPWLGGALLAAGRADLGFTAFAVTGLFGAAMMALASLTIRFRGPRSSRQRSEAGG
ncbi:MFS transporter [Saccharopolyspora gregorii]|uniref:Aromatic acid/H+ symport family MFS transporter n=1 Tax=Saccharopolyspora gregorii TaxID=33914 RepID=A0ABP6RT50_9PSEU